MSPPVHVGDLCAADIEVRSTEVDGHLVLAVATGQHRVDLVADCCDDPERAAQGYDRLASAALALAELVRQRARWTA